MGIRFSHGAHHHAAALPCLRHVVAQVSERCERASEEPLCLVSRLFSGHVDGGFEETSLARFDW
jgi:hypothetical protein